MILYGILVVLIIILLYKYNCEEENFYENILELNEPLPPVL